MTVTTVTQCNVSSGNASGGRHTHTCAHSSAPVPSSASVTASVGTRAFRRAKHSQMEHIQVVMWRTWILHQATGGGGYDVSTYSHYYTTRGIYVGLKHIAKWDDIIRALILIQSTLRAMCTNQNKFQTLLLLCRRWIITQCGEICIRNSGVALYSSQHFNFIITLCSLYM